MEDARDVIVIRAFCPERLDTGEVLKEPTPWDKNHGILPDSGGHLVERRHGVLPPR